MKRQLNSIQINQYSKQLLKAWDANIDIEFVDSAYAAVVYIISYISKAERNWPFARKSTKKLLMRAMSVKGH